MLGASVSRLAAARRWASGFDRSAGRAVVGATSRGIAAGTPLRRWGAREFQPGPSLTTPGELAAFARRATGGYFHLVGTCAMGQGPDSVVDPRLRVHGLVGLRVADASIIPGIGSVNTNATVIAVAERAAAIIRD